MEDDTLAEHFLFELVAKKLRCNPYVGKDGTTEEKLYAQMVREIVCNELEKLHKRKKNYGTTK